MDYIRQKVSGNKIRFTRDGFDLDLTYITSRVIAMAFPAEGFESVYRNPLTEVARFFNERHANHYMVINASSRSYPYERFRYNVYSIEWPNHYPCPFKTFVETILDSSFYLIQDRENVLAVHCLAGKGRTGSLICGILLNSGKFKDVQEVNNFYLLRRGVNVTFASQVRYLYYYLRYLNGGSAAMNFQGMVVTQVVIRSPSKDFFMEKRYRIEFEDFGLREELFSVEIDGNDCKSDPKGEGYLYVIDVPHWNDPNARDILLAFKSKGIWSDNLHFRMNFSMYFSDDIMTFHESDVDDLKELNFKFKFSMKLKPVKNVVLEKNLNEFKKFDGQIEILKKKQEMKGFSDYFLGSINPD